MHCLRLVPVLFCLLPASSLPAQTHEWVTLGPNAFPAHWTDPGNWADFSSPNDPAATAVFNAFPLGAHQDSSLPGTGPALIANNITVSMAEIRYQVGGSDSPQTGAGLFLGSFQSSPVFGSTTGTLRLHGTGLTHASPVPASFQPPTIAIINGRLEFLNSASAGSYRITGSPTISSGAFATSTVEFHDTASADTALIETGGFMRFFNQSTADNSRIVLYSPGSDGSTFLDFWDESTAGSAAVTLGNFSVVSFHDSATAGNATLTTTGSGGPRHLNFADQSTAGTSVITADNALRVEFSGDASAGSARFTLNRVSTVAFRGLSTAAAATVLGAGRVEFRDSATAGGGDILATRIAFTDSANAGAADLAVQSEDPAAEIAFSGNSSAGNARIALGRIGRLTFSDQSDAGQASVQLGDGEIVIAHSARTAGLTIGGGPPFLFRGWLDLTQADHDVELYAVTYPTLSVDLGARSLVFTDTGASLPSVLGGVIAGNGGLTWDRSNILTVSNPANTFTGLTRIQRGQLFLQGGRVAETEIGGASLRGTGMIAGHLRNQGVVSPDAILVSGDYTQAALGALFISAVPQTETSPLTILGTAFLNGTLSVAYTPGFQPVGDSTLNLLSAGAVSGQFATVNLPADTSAALSRALQYTGSGVRLVVTQHPFASFGRNAAGTALGAYLDSTVAGASGTHRPFLAHLNALESAADVAAALGALAPDRYAALPEESLLGAVARQTAQEARFSAARRERGRGPVVFFEAGRRESRLAASDGLPRANAQTSGGTAGLWWQNEGHGLGLSLTREDTALELDAPGSSADTGLLVPTLAYQFAGAGYFLNAAVSSARGEHDLRRYIRYPGTQNAAAGATDSRHVTVCAALGRTIALGVWTLTPQLGLLHQNWEADAFSEGGYAPLEISDWYARSLHLRAGFDVAYRGRTFAPSLTLAWLREASRDQVFQTGFAGTSARYAAPGRSSGRNLVSARLSVDKSLGRAAVLSVSLGGLWRNDARVDADISAGLRWRF